MATFGGQPVEKGPIKQESEVVLWTLHILHNISRTVFCIGFGRFDPCIKCLTPS